MPKRGISLHWMLADRVGELAHEHGATWNRMAIVLIQLGIPVAEKLRQYSPAMLRDYIEVRHRVKPRTAANITRFADSAARKLRFDARISAALPAPQKEKIRREADRRGHSMSHLLREKLEAT